MSFVAMRAASAGICNLCTNDIQVDANVFSHSVPVASTAETTELNSVENHQFHRSCVIQKVVSLSLDDLDLTCSDCQLNITEINGLPFARFRRDVVEKGNDLIRYMHEGSLANFGYIERRSPDWATDMPDIFDQALMASACLGNFEVFQGLNQKPSATNAQRGRALIFAAGAGRGLLGDDPTNILDPDFAEHPGNKHLEIVELLQSAAISEEDYSHAILSAARHGQTKIAQKLLERGISPECYTVAFRYAKEAGHLDTLRVLISNYPNTDNYIIQLKAKGEIFLGNAIPVKRELLKYSIDGNSYAIDLCLDDDDIKKFSEWRGEAVCAIANREKLKPLHLNIVNELLKPVQLKNENNQLLPPQTISTRHRSAAAVSAAKKNHADLLVDILASGVISHKHYLNALWFTMSHETLQERSFARLLEAGEMTQEERDSAFLRARKQIPYLLQLAANGKISEATLDTAYRYSGIFDWALQNAILKIKSDQCARQNPPASGSVVTPLQQVSTSGASPVVLTGSSEQRSTEIFNNTLTSSSVSSTRTSSASSATNQNNGSSTANSNNDSSMRASTNMLSSSRVRSDNSSTPANGQASSGIATSSSEIPNATMSSSSSFFSMKTAIKVAKVILPILAVVGLIVATYAFITFGLINPLTIGFAVGALVLTIASIALFILTRTPAKQPEKIITS